LFSLLGRKIADVNHLHRRPHLLMFQETGAAPGWSYICACSSYCDALTSCIFLFFIFIRFPFSPSIHGDKLAHQVKDNHR